MCSAICYEVRSSKYALYNCLVFSDCEKLQEEILKQLAVCVKLLSLLTDHSLLLDRLQDVTAKSVQWFINSGTEEPLQNKTESGGTEVTCKQHVFLLSNFEAVIKGLVVLCEDERDENEMQFVKYSRTLSQVRSLVCEWLIKMRLYDNAVQMVQNLQETTFKELKLVCEAVSKMYKVIIQTDKTVHQYSEHSLDDITENLCAVHVIMDSVNLENDTDLWLAVRSFNLLLQQINKKYLEHFKSQFTTQNILILAKSCETYVSLCSKTIEQTNNQRTDGPIRTTKDKTGKKVDQDTERRKKSDYVAKLYVLRLGAYFKQLELFSQILQQNLGKILVRNFTYS